ncbi:unnamed protein product (macronuclear) [Paramecium tetraurelia]|uniref:Uncharacterized protein n=1 Tax=Paramecium tetraurelia TaxID=5888 RepID=A0DTF2_PARTE|nr:uncharacterized protein GSPATT00020000001 [Paramecium tetraurelia]CAK86319.1 unnamed protein product [Paramecium tetraurelia]|eukprot:XP_001453716.1 hypothetical protein (macronuclear) [Paramecium tetraurelia strain d4-2]
MKNNILTTSDSNPISRRKHSHPLTTTRLNSSQAQIVPTIYKTPEKSRIFRQKTPSTKTKVKTQNHENKENDNSTINKNSSSLKSNRQAEEKQPSNLMKQINLKLNQKSVSVPDILEDMKEDNQTNSLGLTYFQRAFAQNRVIKIQDLFSQNQITIRELERNWEAQITQESELLKSIQHHENFQYSKNDSKENLLSSLIQIENSTGLQPQIYVIDLALL